MAARKGLLLTIILTELTNLQAGVVKVAEHSRKDLLELIGFYSGRKMFVYLLLC